MARGQFKGSWGCKHIWPPSSVCQKLISLPAVLRPSHAKLGILLGLEHVHTQLLAIWRQPETEMELRTPQLPSLLGILGGKLHLLWN